MVLWSGFVLFEAICMGNAAGHVSTVNVKYLWLLNNIKYKLPWKQDGYFRKVTCNLQT
jgi:hypothetical protein